MQKTAAARATRPLLPPCTLALAALLSACGGGGGPAAVPAPPPPPSLPVNASSKQVQSGGQAIQLTASSGSAAAISWSIADGPGTLSAASGATVSYIPPAGIYAPAAVTIQASAGDLNKTVALTLFPDPQLPGLSLIAGALGGVGYLDGQGTAARFSYIRGASADRDGNLLVLGSPIRKVSANGLVTTTTFQASYGAIDLSTAPDGSVFLLEGGGDMNPMLEQLLPDGSLSLISFWPNQSNFYQPTRVVAASRNLVYLIQANQVVIVTQDGAKPLLVGKSVAAYGECHDGKGSDAQLRYVRDAILGSNGALLMYDCGALRQLTPDGTVITLVGDPVQHGALDGTGSAARFGEYFASLARDLNGNIRVLDYDPPSTEHPAAYTYSLRQITPAGVVTTLGKGSTPQPTAPADAYGRASGALLTLRALANGKFVAFSQASVLSIDDSGKTTPLAGDEGDANNSVDGTVLQARFVAPRALSADRAGNLYVLDAPNPPASRIHKITPSGQVILLANNIEEAYSPDNIQAAPDGTLYLIHQSPKIKLPPPLDGEEQPFAASIYTLSADGLPVLLAGSSTLQYFSKPVVDGPGAGATFYRALLQGLDADGNLYVRDEIDFNGRPRYRKITPQGVVSTLSAVPAGVGLAPDGYRYSVSDDDPGFPMATKPQVLRTAADGSQTVVAGTGQVGNHLGALPGSLAPLKAITPTGPGSFAVISGAAILRLVLPH